MDKEYPSISRKFGANLFLTKGISFFPEGILLFQSKPDFFQSESVLFERTEKKFTPYFFSGLGRFFCHFLAQKVTKEPSPCHHPKNRSTSSFTAEFFSAASFILSPKA